MAPTVPDHTQPKLPPSGKDESVFNLAQAKPQPLQPIENYKGKSLEELEAILDGHNKAATDNKPPLEKPPVAARQNSEKRQSRYNSKGRSDSQNKAPTGRLAQAPSGGRLPNAGGPKPPKAPAAELKKNYGKVPKYLQKFNEQREE